MPAHILLTVLIGILGIIGVLLDLLKWAMILAAIVSTLLAFNVLDSRNRFVWSIADFLYRVTDPILRPIRSRVPPMGNVDVSAMIVILVIQFILDPVIGRIAEDLQMSGAFS